MNKNLVLHTVRSVSLSSRFHGRRVAAALLLAALLLAALLLAACSRGTATSDSQASTSSSTTATTTTAAPTAAALAETWASGASVCRDLIPSQAIDRILGIHDWYVHFDKSNVIYVCSGGDGEYGGRGFELEFSSAEVADNGPYARDYSQWIATTVDIGDPTLTAGYDYWEVDNGHNATVIVRDSEQVFFLLLFRVDLGDVELNLEALTRAVAATPEFAG